MSTWHIFIGGLPCNLYHVSLLGLVSLNQGRGEADSFTLRLFKPKRDQVTNSARWVAEELKYSGAKDRARPHTVNLSYLVDVGCGTVSTEIFRCTRCTLFIQYTMTLDTILPSQVSEISNSNLNYFIFLNKSIFFACPKKKKSGC